MKKILYIGIFIILLFASERTLGGNSKNCIRFSYDNIVITSKYIENELDSCLGYYDLKIVKNDSTSVLTGLTIDQESDLFYTSSDNYPSYYKSLAVFSLTPPEKDVVPEGLLIFDTKKTGKFSEIECINLFGYIAHLIYELLIEYSNYESKKKQKDCQAV